MRVTKYFAAVVLLTVGMLVLASESGKSDESQSELKVSVPSSRPDMVSGGDALIHIDVPSKVSLSELQIFINGTDRSAEFRTESNQHRLIGRIDGLINGSNQVVVAIEGNAPPAFLTLVNHPIEGPVFSGPHEQPFICETESFVLATEQLLGLPLDENCSVQRRVDYVYLPVDGTALRPLADSTYIPSDVTYVTTLTGAVVPYIVRIETGTINRAIYQISMLHSPGNGDPEPAPWAALPAWNGRLIYTFGGGCVNGWYRQGNKTGGVTDDLMLRQGYAVASSSLNVFGNNCNAVLAAETMMMVKERFIEVYGRPRYTIGWGCSGGSYQNFQIADNYPGLLDGIIPGCSFPDVGFSTIPMVTDARLLDHYFRETAREVFTDEQQQAVVGFLKLATMRKVSNKAGRITVGEFCPEILPENIRYDAKNNPSGVRCDVYSHHVNIYGRNPATGFVRRPLDNAGIQYGLKALNDGIITPVQFLDLNRRIGGYDQDGNFQTERTAADLQAVQVAYETGRLTHGGGGLAYIPIIDYRAYTDDREAGDIHVRYHSFSMRERLRKANGHFENHVMLVEDDRYGYYSSKSPVLREALAHMDRWLENLLADESENSQIEKIIRAKPVDLADSCWSRDEIPVRIVENQVRGSGMCETLYPSASFPREAAGAPIASDIIKCRLKPIDLSDYTVKFTADQIKELNAIFADGVCDWTEPGAEQAELKGTWLTF